MSAEQVDGIEVEMMPGPGGTWWQIVERDERGFPIELRQMHDVAAVRDADGSIVGFSIGCHPSRGLFHPLDVVFKPDPVPAPEVGGHACAMLADLDCYAAAGDTTAAALARFHEDHPDGPQSAAEYAEEAAIRAGFMKRRSA